jgi:hypothetical protein
MPKLRNQLGKSKLSGGQGQIDRTKLKRKEVRNAYEAVHLARRWHNIRLDRAAEGYPTNIMETRRKVKEAERHYRNLTGEDCP